MGHAVEPDFDDVFMCGDSRFVVFDTSEDGVAIVDSSGNERFVSWDDAEYIDESDGRRFFSCAGGSSEEES